MKKLVSLLLIVLVSVFVIGCGKEKETPLPNDNKSSDQISTDTPSIDKVAVKKEIEVFLLKIAKEKYADADLEKDVKTTISLGDMEEVFKVDISKFKTDMYGCDLKQTYVTITGKADGEKDYTPTIGCSKAY